MYLQWSAHCLVQTRKMQVVLAARTEFYEDFWLFQMCHDLWERSDDSILGLQRFKSLDHSCFLNMLRETTLRKQPVWGDLLSYFLWCFSFLAGWMEITPLVLIIHNFCEEWIYGDRYRATWSRKVGSAIELFVFFLLLFILLVLFPPLPTPWGHLSLRK